MLNALNEVMRESYLKDCEIGLKRWNRMIRNAGFDFELKLPSPRFRRTIGSWAGAFADPAGRLTPESAWREQLPGWIPSEGDRAFVRSLMQQVTEPGKMAGWIAPPERGVGEKPPEFEYVRLN